MSNIYLLNLNNLELYDDYKKLVSNRCIEKAEKFQLIDDAKRTIGAELIVRYLLKKIYGYSNSEIEFEYNKYGKPYLKNGCDFFFNISHSGSWIACGVSNHEIGIDIEEIKDIDLKIANHFFSRGEQKYIFQTSIDRNRRFMIIWCLRECYTKQLGKGLLIPMDSYEIVIQRKDYKVNSLLCNRVVYLKKTEQIENYILSECNEDNSEIDLNILNISEIIEEIFD